MHGIHIDRPYTLLGARTVEKAAKYLGTRLLHLHNPWGETEWGGSFGNSWEGWAEPELHKAAATGPCDVA